MPASLYAAETRPQAFFKVLGDSYLRFVVHHRLVVNSAHRERHICFEPMPVHGLIPADGGRRQDAVVLMTAKEYLQQAYRLDNRINSNLAEISRLRELTKSISSPDFGEHFNPNHTTEAPFICSLERIWELERKIDAEIDLLVELKG